MLFWIILQSFTHFLDIAFFSGYIFDEDQSDELTNTDYSLLSGEIGHRWKRFARQVNINENTIEDLVNMGHRESERCYKIFSILEARDGSVKWNLIKMVLQDLELYNIIKNLNLQK